MEFKKFHGKAYILRFLKDPDRHYELLQLIIEFFFAQYANWPWESSNFKEKAVFLVDPEIQIRNILTTNEFSFDEDLDLQFE